MKPDIDHFDDPPNKNNKMHKVHNHYFFVLVLKNHIL